MEKIEKEPFGQERAISENPENKLECLLEQLSERLREEGVPVDRECRIEMSEFKDIYSKQEIDHDKEIITRWERKWAEDRNIGNTRAGEQVERLITINLAKFLGNQFVVVRTSRFDDIEHKIDNIIIEKETGVPICAYDEVSEISGKRFEEKKEQVLERNKAQKGGGSLKYGIYIKEGAIQKGKVKNLPIFYLAFPKEELPRAVRETQTSLEQKTEYEEKIFAHLVALIRSQIKTLRLKNISPQVSQKIDYFEKILEKIDI